MAAPVQNPDNNLATLENPVAPEIKREVMVGRLHALAVQHVHQLADIVTRGQFVLRLVSLGVCTLRSEGGVVELAMARVLRRCPDQQLPTG